MRQVRAKRSGALPAQRFTFECACGQGTEDAKEYERHLLDCPRILPGVREAIMSKVRRGERVAFSPRELSEERAKTAPRVGQGVIPGTESIPHVKRRGRVT